MVDTFYIDDSWKLKLFIYVLGYYPEGESIFIVLYDESSRKPLKTILADCYEQNGINIFESVLDLYNIQDEKLDYLIWTHPDHDHSVGFSNIVNKYTSRKTIVIYPEGMPIFSILKNMQTSKSWYAIIKNKVLGKYCVESVNTSNHRCYPLLYSSSYSDGVYDPIIFSIEILTPFATQNSRNILFNNSHNANVISISFIIRLGNLGFYFGGDTEDMAIKEIERDRFRDLYFVKIPHHGSDTSIILPGILTDLLDENESPQIVSITTGYHKGRSNLPAHSVLDLYKSNSTKILITEDDRHQNKYGYWEYIFDRGSGFPFSLSSVGDSMVYYEYN